MIYAIKAQGPGTHGVLRWVTVQDISDVSYVRLDDVPELFTNLPDRWLARCPSDWRAEIVGITMNWRKL